MTGPRRASHVGTPARPWDRTRWDRTQAAVIVASLAVITGLPGWVALALIAGGLT